MEEQATTRTGALRALLHRITSPQLRAAAVEVLQWRYGRVARTKERVLRQYRSTPRIELEQRVLAITPNGMVIETSLAEVRGHVTALLTTALADVGVTSGTVLEAGAGDGTDLRAMRRIMPSVHFVGCDLVPRSREIVPADMYHLPFATESVDAVITSRVLEQLPSDVGRAMREIARVTKRWLSSIEPDYERATWLQRLYMIRQDYVRDIVGPARDAGLELIRREWSYGGNPLNRPSMFVFAKRSVR